MRRADGFRDVLASGKRARLKCVAKRPKLGEEEIKRGVSLSDLRYNFRGRGTLRK